MFVGECLIERWVVIHVICIGLMLRVKNFFIGDVLVGRSGIEDMMLGFIGKRLLTIMI